MKRLFGAVLCAGSLIALSSCNKQMIDLNYSFNKMHLYENSTDYTIKSWKDFSDGTIQVKLKDGTVLVLHQNNCMLIHGDCPICDN